MQESGRWRYHGFIPMKRIFQRSAKPVIIRRLILIDHEVPVVNVRKPHCSPGDPGKLSIFRRIVRQDKEQGVSIDQPVSRAEKPPELRVHGLQCAGICPHAVPAFDQHNRKQAVLLCPLENVCVVSVSASVCEALPEQAVFQMIRYHSAILAQYGLG